MAIETKGLLIGEAANRDVVAGIREIAAGSRCVEKVNEVLTMHMGPDFILANISVHFRDGLETGEVERAVAQLDRTIKSRYGIVKRIFIEAESATAPLRPADPNTAQASPHAPQEEA